MTEFTTNKLFRVTLQGHKWERMKSLYVIAKDKESATKYVNEHKRDGYEVCKVIYLGDELSRVCFSPNILTHKGGQ
jgi:hypothetical protein